MNKSQAHRSKSEIEVSPVTSIFIMLTTVFTVLASGAILALFSSSYESSCTPNETGKTICTTTVKFRGWEGLPLQALPGAIGTGLGIYAAFKAGKLPSPPAQAETNDLHS
ncbi:MAG: hypothetical protein ACRCZS_06680 [Chroococcidiopsis sp.]